MNREQAKELKYMRSKQSESISFDRLDFMLDEIYDDFESRTCKSCKYSGLYTMGWMPCLHPENEYHIKEVHDDFGCNKWEPNV